MANKISRNTLNTPNRNHNSDVNNHLKNLPKSLFSVYQKYTLSIEILLNITFKKAQEIIFTAANTTTNNTLALKLFDDNRILKIQKKQVIRGLIKDIDIAFSELTSPHCQLDELCKKKILTPQQLKTLNQHEEKNILIVASITNHIENILSTRNKINILKIVGITVLFEQQKQQLPLSHEAGTLLTATFNEVIAGAFNKIYNAINTQLNLQGKELVNSATNQSSASKDSLLAVRSQKHQPGINITLLLDNIFNPLITKDTLTKKEQIRILNVIQQESLTLSTHNTLEDITTLITHTQKKLKIIGTIPDYTFELIRLSSITFKVINSSLHIDDKIKMFINRLIVPTIKTTLIDKDFFNQSRHPLRVLLNEINIFGLGWQHSEDPTYTSYIIKTIDRLTADICQNFESNINVFSTALNELKKIQTKDETQLSLLSSRLAFNPDGEQLAKDADNIASITIKSELERLNPSAVICVFAEIIWHKVLTVTALHTGVDSPQWLNHMALFQELCHLATPCQSNTEKNIRIKRLPSFMLHMQRSFTLCAHSAFDAEEIIESLSHTFTQCLNGKTANQDFILKNIHGKETPNPKNIEQAHPAIKKTATFKRETKHQLNNSVKNSKTRSAAINKKSAVNISNTEKSLQTENKDQQNNYTELKNNVLCFTRGMLFDLQVPNKGVVRCRLAAIIKQTNHYIFINRNGIKIAQYSLDETINAIKEQNLTALESNNGVFDTALEEVVSGMRKK